VRARLDAAGAFVATRALAERDAGRAVAAAEALPPGPWCERLREAARRAVARDR
ncbi:MAG: octaprenyl diphosphate synthase, partial [Deltaproteobacteria bacterium]|nr:octaprenyl diphosphate synthase [Deltaproteobacteria bacterium]